MDDRYDTLVDAVHDSMIRGKWIIYESNSKTDRKRITTLDSDSATIIREYEFP